MPTVDNGRNHDKKPTMKEGKRKKPTVQGVGSPVPAAVRGDRAGPGASISSDCKATEVEHLASIADNATSCCKGSTKEVEVGEGNESMKPLTSTAEKAVKAGNEMDPFRRSSKLPRSPPNEVAKTPTKEKEPSRGTHPRGTLPSITGNSGGVTGRDTPKTPGSVQETPVTKKDSSETAKVSKASPMRTFLIRMRKEEEEALHNCRAIVARMKTAASRQKTMSMEIKNGVVELEEALDVISSCRANWEKAEAELQKSADKNVQPTLPETSKKRAASSPVEREERKKKRGAGPPMAPEWTVTVSKRPVRRDKEEVARLPTQPRAENGTRDHEKPQRRKKRKRSRKKTRPEALLIKPAEGLTYAEVLGEIRRKVKPEDMKTEIKSIRQTRQGEVLLELGRKTEDKAVFQEAVAGILDGKATIHSLKPRRTLEIRNLDCFTEKEEVEQALKRDFPTLGDIKVLLTGPNSYKQKTAIVEIEERAADKLLNQARIKVGWLYCRVRERTTVARCFRCLGYGHVARDCSGPDRSNVCYKCGATGHKGKTCEAPESCVLCKERGVDQQGLSHIPGSGRCRVFREALERSKKVPK